MAAKRFYAVQHGDNYDSDWGSTRKVEAMKMAKDLAKNPRYDGEEIRISVCTTEDDYCTEEIIIRQDSGICKQKLKDDAHYFAIMYCSDFALGDDDDKIKAWDTARVYRFKTKNKRDAFCDGYHLNRPISRERAYYIGWVDYDDET